MSEAEVSALAGEGGMRGRDKVNLYKWRTKGKPAEFAWLPKRSLHVDKSYQRESIQERILSMARDWDWVACGSIIVALRGDGEWYVIDGQHRVEAAKRRSDIIELPCLIFELESTKEEAAGFLSSNTGRKAMSYYERFNALITAEDPVALKIHQILSSGERKVAKFGGPKTVACVSTLMWAIALDEECFRRIWPIVLNVTEGEPIESPVVKGFMWLEGALLDGVSLSDRRWRDRIISVGYVAIRREMANNAAYLGRGGSIAWGMGLLAAINKGLRSKLEIRPRKGLVQPD